MKSILFNQTNITPSKIICVGRNYAAHIQEMESEVPTEPVIFLKPNSAITNSLRFNATDAVHYEAELTFLIRGGKLHAVGFGLDLTKREVQAELKAKGLPWERSKAFDGSAVFSDFVTFDGDIKTLSTELLINGQQIQHGTYELMLNKPCELLEEVATFITAEDNDLLMTGTPKGVGPLVLGDRFTGKVYSGDELLVEKSWVVE